jgi:hypothetical protein
LSINLITCMVGMSHVMSTPLRFISDIVAPVCYW